jgi:ketosteroid isomerase-like protein
MDGAGMSRANVEVIERFEDAFVRGDMDEVLSLLSPDIVVHEAPSLPYPGDHRGHDGFLALTDAFNKVWQIVSDLDITFLDAGDAHVVALVAYDVVTRPTGVPLRLRMVEVYTVGDGQITDLEVYYHDTAAIVEATGGLRVL